jgi:hypothetical protein
MCIRTVDMYVCMHICMHADVFANFDVMFVIHVCVLQSSTFARVVSAYTHVMYAYTYAMHVVVAHTCNVCVFVCVQ